MNKTLTLLKALFFVPIALSLALVVLFETGLLVPGAAQMSANARFLLLSCAELLTLAAIPAALYLFKLKPVRQALAARRQQAVRRFGCLRLLVLGVGMVANTLLYYLTLDVSYGYMAIIFLIVMPFVYPSRARIESETAESGA